MKTLTLLLLFCIGIVSPAVYAQEQDEDLSDYKTACLEAIDNIGKISDGFSVSSMITIAKSSLNACGTKDDMRRTMTALRAGVTGYLQTVSTFPDGQVYTGLLGNRSFDTGDLSTWYCVDFDLSQISLTDITNAIGRSRRERGSRCHSGRPRKILPEQQPADHAARHRTAGRHLQP